MKLLVKLEYALAAIEEATTLCRPQEHELRTIEERMVCTATLDCQRQLNRSVRILRDDVWRRNTPNDDPMPRNHS